MNGEQDVEASVRELFRSHEHLASSAAPPDTLATSAKAALRRSRRTTLTAVLASAACIGIATSVAASSLMANHGDAGQPITAATRVVPADLPTPLRDRALLALERFEAVTGPSAGLIVVAGPLLMQVGDWEPSVGQDKLALADGQVTAAPGALPTTAPASGVVRWQRGRDLEVPLLTAEDALAAMASPKHDCDGCQPLVVTGATLSAMTLQTGTGPATVPAWEFSLRGTAVRVRYVAIDPARLVDPRPLSQPSNDDFLYRVDKASVSSDGRSVTVSFVGAAPGTGSCESEYRADAVEGATAVVVVIRALPRPTATPARGQACPLVGHLRRASADLTMPLGDRSVLDPASGTPVPITR